jgi:hypothetical protein
MAELAVTPANILKTTTTAIAEGIAGGTLTAGMAIYIDTAASGVIKACDADALASSICAGIALHAASPGQPIKYATSGDLTFSTMAVGTVYFVAITTAGSLCESSDISTGDYVSIVGVATTATNLKLGINNSGIIR